MQHVMRHRLKPKMTARPTMKSEKTKSLVRGRRVGKGKIMRKPKSEKEIDAMGADLLGDTPF